MFQLITYKNKLYFQINNIFDKPWMVILMSSAQCWHAENPLYKRVIIERTGDESSRR